MLNVVFNIINNKIIMKYHYICNKFLKNIDSTKGCLGYKTIGTHTLLVGMNYDKISL